MGRVELGDWQTPPALASAVLAVAARFVPAPAHVVEPTCGVGAFLAAAGERFPGARLAGFELQARHAAKARACLPRGRARVTTADFFEVDWERELAAREGPLLVVGNPPWVTSAELGARGSANLPAKDASKALRGHDPRTGKSNFDVSEWMILRLLEALEGRPATLAMLCKSAVVRRVLERGLPLAPGGLFTIDAAASFGVATTAVLFVARTGVSARPKRFPMYRSLDARRASSAIELREGGVLAADARAFERTCHLAGDSDPEWRSGVKHDCARVMELTRAGRAWVNGLGHEVDVEDAVLFPLLKSSDVANDRSAARRAMIVPQRALGEDTRALRLAAPRAWAYLRRHASLLAARKSAVYRAQPPFAIFGVGPYSFAPWKVAVSGLYKRYAFTLVGPEADRPVVLDDTCYFLPFADEASAAKTLALLRSPPAAEFFAARTFWDDKRPIRKSILQTLDLRALDRALTR